MKQQYVTLEMISRMHAESLARLIVDAKDNDVKAAITVLMEALLILDPRGEIFKVAFEFINKQQAATAQQQNQQEEVPFWSLKRDALDDYSCYVAVAVPRTMIGAIIGKSGAAIRYIQQSSGAHVQVEKDSEIASRLGVGTGIVQAAGAVIDAIVIITGTIVETLIAQTLVSTIVYDKMKDRNNGNHDGLVSSNEFKHKLVIIVPYKFSGYITGENLEILKKIEGQSNATIRVDTLTPSTSMTAGIRVEICSNRIHDNSLAQYLLVRHVYASENPNEVGSFTPIDGPPPVVQPQLTDQVGKFQAQQPSPLVPSNSFPGALNQVPLAQPSIHRANSVNVNVNVSVNATAGGPDGPQGTHVAAAVTTTAIEGGENANGPVSSTSVSGIMVGGPVHSINSDAGTGNSSDDGNSFSADDLNGLGGMSLSDNNGMFGDQQPYGSEGLTSPVNNGERGSLASEGSRGSASSGDSPPLTQMSEFSSADITNYSAAFSDGLSLPLTSAVVHSTPTSANHDPSNQFSQSFPVVSKGAGGSSGAPDANFPCSCGKCSRIAVGQTVSNFVARSTMGQIEFFKYIEKKWCVMFTMPHNFGPVHTSEMCALSKDLAKFKKRRTVIMAVSPSSITSNLLWVQEIAKVENVQPAIPIVSDDTRTVLGQFGVVPKCFPEGSLSADTRKMIIIGPDKKIVNIFTYPENCGSSVEELLRTIDSLQVNAKSRGLLATPANWTKRHHLILLPNKAENLSASPQISMDMASQQQLVPSSSMDNLEESADARTLYKKLEGESKVISALCGWRSVPPQPVALSASCACKRVTMKVNERALYSYYCHCGQCRKSSAAPALWLLGFPSGSVKLIGNRFLKAYTSGAMPRYCCTECSTYCYASMEGFADVIPGALIAQSNPDGVEKPQFHLYYDDRVLAMEDGLPKYPEGLGFRKGNK